MRQSKTSKKYAKAPRNDGTPDKEVTVRIRGGSVAISQKDSVILTRGLRSGGENQEAINMEEGRSGCLPVGPAESVSHQSKGLGLV